MCSSDFLRGDLLPKTEIKITEFSLLTESYQVPNEYMVNRRYKLKLAWDASYYENNLKKGDFFVVNLPKAFIFPSNHSACNFDILAPDGTTVVAKAVVTPGPENAGGNVKVTFTEYVENKHNIKGTMFLAATFNQKEITVGQDNVLEISIGSYKKKITVPIVPTPPKPPKPLDEILQKWSSSKVDENQYVKWTARINHKKKTLNNVELTDTLGVKTGDPTGLRFIKNSFRLQEVEMDEFGNVKKKIGAARDISADVVFSNNDRTFTYKMGKIDGKQYHLTYKSNYKNGMEIRNRLELKSNEEKVVKTGVFIDVTSGGEGSGDPLSKIKIIKVDKENNAIKLKGAIFKIVRKSNGSSFELVTDDAGEAMSEKLIPGEYTIKEVTPPPGYIGDDQTYTEAPSRKT